MSEKLTGYPSIDKPWLKYYSREAINAPLPEDTLYHFLWQKNKAYLNDTALVYYGRKFTYGQMFDETERVRNALLNNGIKKGDKVILFTSSTPETLYVILALSRIGAVGNMINPLFTKEQIKDRINETDAEVMILLDQLFDKVDSLLGEICVKKTIVVPVYRSIPTVKGRLAKWKLKKPIPYSEAIVSWDVFMKDCINTQPDAPYEKDRPLIMVYSSGSTGASKGIVLTNNGILATASNYLRTEYFPHERGESFLQMIPVWFSTGIIISLLMPLSVGVFIILEPLFSKESFVKDIKKHKPNMTLGATSLWMHAIHCNELAKADLSFMHYPITGGEKLLTRDEEAINDFLRRHGCRSPIIAGYGMCELGGTVTTASAIHHKLGSAGLPIKGVTVSAFDPVTHQEQKAGARGEIRVDTPCRMKEYFKNSKATDEFFWKDDKGTVWGRTGDIGYVDEDGFVFIQGRATDSCVLENGERVYLFDIEDEIMKDESVAQCKVVDIQYENKTRLAAHIVFVKGTPDPQAGINRIHKSLKASMPEYMVPGVYKIRDSIPVHANGKRDVEAMKQDMGDLIIPEE